MDVKKSLRRELVRVPGLLTLARLVAGTFRVCMKNRVTGLAAEAGFFALLSLPPLIFGLLGAVGYLGQWLGPDIVGQVTANIEHYAAGLLSEQSLRDVIMPTIKSALSAGRPDVVSVGFVLSLWSGSRALNVMLDTVSIMYGHGGHRSIVRARLLSLSLYFAGLIFGAIVVPLIVIGPNMLSSWLPTGLRFLMVLYWPLVGGMTILTLATFFHIATPGRLPWLRHLPGATLTLAIWVSASMLLRWFLGRSIGDHSASIYGPLAAAIVVMTWLYFLGIAVLIGAAMNAASVRLWPAPERIPVMERAIEWIGDGVIKLRESAVDVDPRPVKTPLRRPAAPEPRRVRAIPRAVPEDTLSEEPRLDSRRAIG